MQRDSGQEPAAIAVAWSMALHLLRLCLASFVPGADWRLGLGLAAGHELPLARALRRGAWDCTCGKKACEGHQRASRERVLRRCAADAFAAAAQEGSRALALESAGLSWPLLGSAAILWNLGYEVKLLPVTQALEACDCRVVSSLPDLLEALLPYSSGCTLR